MDEETEEKIAKGLHSIERRLMREGSQCNCLWENLADEYKERYRVNASWFLDSIIQSGYRKLPKEKPPLLIDEEWEKINRKSRNDVVGMVMDFQHNRITASELMNKIVYRCNLTAQAQRELDIKHYETHS